MKKPIKAILCDLDGTMYHGTRPIEAAKRFLKRMKEAGVPVIFLTNNASRTPEQNVEHMEKMGFTQIGPSQFFNSAMASAQYVAQHFSGRKAWYVGTDALKQALVLNGFECTDQHPDFVFVGLDTQATYHTYSRALRLLLQGALLVGTNGDRILATASGFDVGNGSVVKMLEYASEKEAIWIGKPNRAILDTCLAHYQLEPEEVLLVGDNLETDIALGYNNQVKTVFVQSGVHKQSDIDRLNIHPDIVLENLDEFGTELLTEESGK